MEILVSGAGGFVGGALVPELVRRGHRVRAATRDPGRYRGPAEAEPRRFDLDDAATLEPALDGVEVAYHLVHSMDQTGEFARRDLWHARAFGRAAPGGRGRPGGVPVGAGRRPGGAQRAPGQPPGRGGGGCR